jgi:hypothetical protein
MSAITTVDLGKRPWSGKEARGVLLMTEQTGEEALVRERSKRYSVDDRTDWGRGLGQGKKQEVFCC